MAKRELFLLRNLNKQTNLDFTIAIPVYSYNKNFFS